MWEKYGDVLDQCFLFRVRKWELCFMGKLVINHPKLYLFQGFSRKPWTFATRNINCLALAPSFSCNIHYQLLASDIPKVPLKFYKVNVVVFFLITFDTVQSSHKMSQEIINIISLVGLIPPWQFQTASRKSSWTQARTLHDDSRSSSGNLRYSQVSGQRLFIHIPSGKLTYCNYGKSVFFNGKTH